MTSLPGEVTQLLGEYRRGDRDALERLMALMYKELRKLAAYHMRGERLDHTLQPTALVNEVYLHLADERPIEWQNRAHLIALASQAMRRVLVDHARAHRAGKRAGNLARVTLGEGVAATRQRDVEVIMLDTALSKLEAMDPRLVRVVELKYFGGLTNPEIAEVLGISEATVDRDRAAATAWLRRELR